MATAAAAEDPPNTSDGNGGGEFSGEGRAAAFARNFCADVKTCASLAPVNYGSYVIKRSLLRFRKRTGHTRAIPTAVMNTRFTRQRTNDNGDSRTSAYTTNTGEQCYNCHYHTVYRAPCCLVILLLLLLLCAAGGQLALFVCLIHENQMFWR